MRLHDLILFALRALLGHRLRTVLSLIGMAIGVGAVILLTSLGEGARRYITEQFASIGSNLIIVFPGRNETTGFFPGAIGVPHDLTLEDVEAVLRAVEASLADFSGSDAFFRRWPLRFARVLDPPLHGHEQPADHPWTVCLLGAARGIVGEPAKVAASQWPCDAFIHQRFGMPTLLFGPKGAGSHNANEYVELRSVLRTAETYLAAALKWCA